MKTWRRTAAYSPTLHDQSLVRTRVRGSLWSVERKTLQLGEWGESEEREGDRWSQLLKERDIDKIKEATVNCIFSRKKSHQTQENLGCGLQWEMPTKLLGL